MAVPVEDHVLLRRALADGDLLPVKTAQKAIFVPILARNSHPEGSMAV
jgi:hypothetical protein